MQKNENAEHSEHAEQAENNSQCRKVCQCRKFENAENLKVRKKEIRKCRNYENAGKSKLLKTVKMLKQKQNAASIDKAENMEMLKI